MEILRLGSNTTVDNPRLASSQCADLVHRGLVLFVVHAFLSALPPRVFARWLASLYLQSPNRVRGRFDPEVRCRLDLQENLFLPVDRSYSSHASHHFFSGKSVPLRESV
jgi:hypothetical protein